MFIPNISVRHNRALRSPVLQEIMSHFPLWTKARSDKHSNMQAMLSPFSLFLEDFKRYAYEASHGTQALTTPVDIWSRVYSWPIDTSFEFNYIDRFDGEVEYLTPDLVQGTKGVRTETLSESFERSPDFMLIELPDYIELDSPELISETNVVGNGDDLNNAEFTLSQDMYLQVLATWNAEVGINIGGDQWLPQITLINEDDETVKHQISIFGDGYYAFPLIVQAGHWRIETFALKDCDLTFYTEGYGARFGFERAHKFSTAIESFDFGYRIGEDPSYLELVTHSPGGIDGRLANEEDYIAHDAIALLDTAGDPVVAIDLVKSVYQPYIWILGDNNTLYAYDTYLEQPQYLYDNTNDYELSLSYDVYDFRLGDVICFRASRKAMFMKEEFNRLRMKVLEKDLNGVETIYWILPDGTVITNAEEAWVDINTNPKYWRDRSWSFTIGSLGSMKLVLEAGKRKAYSLGDDRFDTPSIACEAIIQARGKVPRLEVPLGSVGLGTGRLSQGLRLDVQGLKVVDDLGRAQLVLNESHKYYLDYEGYMLYTLTNWDSIELQVTQP